MTKILEVFSNLAKGYLSDMPFSSEPVPYSLLASPSENKKIPHLVLCAGIHGNELAGVNVFNEILADKKDLLGQLQEPVLFLIGNPEAVRKNIRFVDVDLNRQFCQPNLNTYEGRRSAEILEKVEKAEYLVDIHQTQEPTLSPFGVFPDNPCLLDFFSYFSAGIENVVLVDSITVSGGRCLDEALLRIKPYACAITVEVGGINDKSSHDVAMRCCMSALHASGALKGETNKTVLRKWKEVAFVANTKGTVLVSGLTNFLSVGKGKYIANSPDGQIKAPCDGVALFPKYQPTNDAYLLRIAQQVS